MPARRPVSPAILVRGVVQRLSLRCPLRTRKRGTARSDGRYRPQHRTHADVCRDGPGQDGTDDASEGKARLIKTEHLSLRPCGRDVSEVGCGPDALRSEAGSVNDEPRSICPVLEASA